MEVSDKRSADWIERRPNKRARRTRPEMVFEGIFTPVMFGTRNLCQTNCVYLNGVNYEKLPSSKLIEIGGRVYECAVAHLLEDHQIGLNPLQMSEIEDVVFKDQGYSQVNIVSRSKNEQQDIAMSADVVVNLSDLCPNQTKTTIHLDRFLQLFFIRFSHYTLQTGCTYYLTVDGSLLEITLKNSLTQDGEGIVNPLHFATLSRAVTTLMVFPGKHIEIVQTVRADEIQKLYFTLKSMKTERKESYLIDYEHIKESIFQRIEGKRSALYSSFTQPKNIMITFDRVDAEGVQTDFKAEYELSREIPVCIKAEKGVLLCKTEVKILKLLSLRLLKVVRLKEEKAGVEIEWIAESEVKEALLRKGAIAEGEVCSLTVSGGEYLFLAEAMKDSDDVDYDMDEPLSQKFLILDGFSLELKKKKDVAIRFVKESKPIELSKVVLEVSLPKRSFSVSGEEVSLKEAEVIALFRKRAKRDVYLSQEISVTLSDGQLVHLKVLSMDALFDEPPFGFDTVLGKVDGNTEVKLQQSEGVPPLLKEEKPLDGKSVQEKMLELGIGGLENQIEEIKKFVLLRRGKHSELARRMGLAQEKGIMLYGPPGTGKTILANALADLLGGHGVSVKRICASEVWNMYVGNSEKFIRDLFSEAQEEMKKNGKKARFFVVIIDEIDSILGKRGPDSKRWEISTLNQLLNIMDGKADPKLDNVLVIGMTNRMDDIDPAVLRPGRFGLHLSIDLPKKEAREQIFSIHLKALREQKALADDVKVLDLALATNDFSGAEIMSVVQKATSEALNRALKEDVLDEPKVTNKDLELAIEKVKAQKKSKEPEFSDALKRFYGMT